jgi:hypothetical protein
VLFKALSLALIFVITAGAGPRDVLSRAKQLYNGAQYDAAIDAAREAAKTAELCGAAELVLARAYLERFRQSANDGDRDAAREALKQVQAGALGDEDRVELTIALGESLYFDGQAGAAAEQFDLALARVDRKQPARRERLLDWWATALDRQAQSAVDAAARSLQARIVRRMEDELHGDAGAMVASIAGWVRLSPLGVRGAGARSELDALVTRAIIPDRARVVSPASPDAAAATMRSQWEALKKAWS